MTRGINITPQKFSEWLDTLPSDMIFGENMRCKTCPIAMYFYHLGYDYASVGPHQCNLGYGTEEWMDAPLFDLPMWAVEFIDRYDDGYPDTVGKAQAIVQELV